MITKKSRFSVVLVITLVSLCVLFTPKQASAHGYVSSPISRGYQGYLDNQRLGWVQAHAIYGNVISNPQSLEYLKGFPERGPRDGRIASAEGGLGQIGDFVLDDQSENRWTKQDISTGSLDIRWHYTAVHRTTKWHYYITKDGWNPNEPISRGSFEKISEVSHDGSLSIINEVHKVNIPSDRSGYHVILAIWDIADTPNAFYNVIDVNITPQ